MARCFVCHGSGKCSCGFGKCPRCKGSCNEPR